MRLCGKMKHLHILNGKELSTYDTLKNNFFNDSRLSETGFFNLQRQCFFWR